jgi:hypothetical protein
VSPTYVKALSNVDLPAFVAHDGRDWELLPDAA